MSNPRINVTLDISTYEKLKLIAKKEKVSISSLAKQSIDLLLRRKEDIYLSSLADERTKSVKKSEYLSHDDIWNDV